MTELEAREKCNTIFTRLGWKVSVDKYYKYDTNCKSIKPTFILRYNGKVYGFVEIVTSDGDFVKKCKKASALIETVIKDIKPPIFIVSNGYVYDLFILGESCGTLTVPPMPDEIDILMGKID